ncbi:EAL domain-containing protein [Vibrio pelagius]|uniref:EAL domain-containing protein n=1 Tax=Vibrio pelagius TaxID=28169 RepID=A0ABY5G7J4_VIBPE|nr:EAL domain-containing protein [Vibrio pelagius]UTT86154.1 EAL domain-containing protein [Vibrio pelagius]
MKLLLVEDDSIQSKKLEIDLSNLGCNEIYICDTCESAIACCEEVLFDYIFCDIQLPDKDGIYFLSQIADNQHEANIIITSASSKQVLKLVEQVSSLLKFQSVSRIDKPYNVEQLKSVINRVKEQQKSTPTRNVTNPLVFTESEVMEAIQQGNIFVHYQPQVDISTRKIAGFEALARWDHAIYGVLSAGQFVDVIQSKQTYVSLFRTVLDKSLLGAVAFPDTVTISINITSHDLEWNGLYDEILTKCHEHKFAFHRLTLELTESHLYQTDVASLLTLSRLKLLGIKLAIDDLGSGYSSLLKLTQLPFDELKIDRGLIVDVEHDPKKRIVVQLLFNIADKLNLACVVEGIENEPTLELLRSIGNFRSQGYLTGKPQSLNKISSSLTNHYPGDVNLPIHCLIVDEQPMVGEALNRAFSNEEQVHSVSSVISIPQALNYIRDRSCNLILIDIELRNDSEFDMTKVITSSGFHGKVIFMTSNRQRYIPLSSIENELHILNKNNELDLFVHKALDIFNGVNAGENEQSNLLKIAQLLSRREAQVLDLLMTGKSNKIIARSLNISEKTVSTYKSRILEKLELDHMSDIYRVNLKMQA